MQISTKLDEFTAQGKEVETQNMLGFAHVLSADIAKGNVTKKEEKLRKNWQID